MSSSFILIDKSERKIRADVSEGCLLIFDTRIQAENYLAKVKPISDRENTEIVEKFLTFTDIAKEE